MSNQVSQIWEEVINETVEKFNTFNISKKINLLLKFFEGKINKMKRKSNKFKVFDKVSNTFDSFIISGSTGTSKKLSLTGFGLTVEPITAGVICGEALHLNQHVKFQRKNSSFRKLHCFKKAGRNFRKMDPKNGKILKLMT